MKTRSLTEGAMLGAITVLLTIIGEYIGIPSIIVPVPLMLLVYRQGFRWGILTAVVASLVASLVAGHVFSGISILIWGFVGVTVGMALREKFSFPRLMLVGIFSNIVVMGLNFLLFSLIFGGNPFTEMQAMLIQSIEQAMETSQSLGVPSEALERYEMLLVTVPLIFTWGLPSLLFISSLVMTYINLAVVRLILRRLGDSMPWVRPFTAWRLPPVFSVLLFLGLVITLMAQTMVLPYWLNLVGVNLFIVVFQAYLVVGIGLGWYYLKKKNVPVFLRIILIFLLFSMELLMLALILVAIADGVFDFRRVNQDEGEIVVESKDDN